ncbi:MAG TPA: hypothetical protein VGB55_03300 [Tepidisphaeraceae bacterium]|jgi:hypothetical protein
MPHVGKPADRDVPGPPKPNTPDESTSVQPLTPQSEIKGSMKTEEPLGWDQAPKDIHDPRQQRHPRPDGVGGIEPAKED